MTEHTEHDSVLHCTPSHAVYVTTRVCVCMHTHTHTLLICCNFSYSISVCTSNGCFYGVFDRGKWTKVWCPLFRQIRVIERELRILFHNIFPRYFVCYFIHYFGDVLWKLQLLYTLCVNS